MIIVRMSHIRGIFCSRGARHILKDYGFDLSDAVLNGIPIEKLEATGDDLILRVCEKARAEAESK